MVPILLRSHTSYWKVRSLDSGRTPFMNLLADKQGTSEPERETEREDVAPGAQASAIIAASGRAGGCNTSALSRAGYAASKCQARMY